MKFTSQVPSSVASEPEVTDAAGARAQPATALPWRAQPMDSPFRSHFGDGYEIYSGDAYIATLKIDGAHRHEKDAGYLVHACNAYPRLVAALKGCEPQLVGRKRFAVLQILRELGEL